MIVQIVSSSSCRGWEGNNVEYEESDCENVLEYVKKMLEEEGYNKKEVKKMLSGKECDDSGFGWTDCTEDGCHYDGDEGNVSYYKFEVTDEFLEMLKRNK